MSEVVVTSWNHLQDELYEDSWNEHLGRFRSKRAFRGLSYCNYQLKTTLMRLGGEYQNLEKHLSRNFRKYAHRNLVEHDSLWHWLSVAQHYGLPTRLLDWTYSPFIAMHFATSNIEHFEIDGVIWAVNYVETHKLLPKVLRDELQREGANVLTTKMLMNAAPTLQKFSELSEDEFVAFFEPPSIDDRIVNQFAFFSVMPHATSLMDKWLVNHKNIYKKIIIPAKLKWEIRDKLDQANITEKVLFPGLDGLCRWLKRQYSPRCDR